MFRTNQRASKKVPSRVLVVQLVLTACLTAGLCGAVCAGDIEKTYHIHIAQSSVEKALKALAQQTGVQLLFPFDLVKNFEARPVRGEYTVMEALTILLQDTGFSGGLTGSGVITISTASSPDKYNEGKKKMKSKKNLLVAAITFLFSSGNSQPGLAQESEELTLELEEVVVTARKRAESLQEIPIAISAFDAQTIEAMGLESIRDLSAITPGFFYESFTTAPGRFDNSPRFRGVAVNTGAPTRQTASVFVDGVFVANGAQGIGLEDVERVEIIKGPQSAYFGRNTFAGAINYVTTTPGDEFSARITGDVATRDDHLLQASVEGPLGVDWLKGRLSISSHDKGGHYTSSDGTELGQQTTDSIGATLFLQPVDNFSARVRAYYYENDDTAPAIGLVGINFHNCGPFGGVKPTICGDLPNPEADSNTIVDEALNNKLNQLFPLHGSHRRTYGLDREALRLSAQFTYDIPATNLTVTGLVATNQSEVRTLTDADNSPDERFIAFAAREFKDDSLELRVSGEHFEDRLAWSLGANIFEQEFTSNGSFIAPLSNYSSFGDNGEPEREVIETQGIFASVSYRITDQIRVALEARYQEDDVEENNDITDDVPAAKGSFDNTLPRVIVDWTPNEDALFYVSYSEGNLPGGFNGNVADLTPAQLAELLQIQSSASDTFEEEELKNYELGWKQTFERYQIAVAAFFMERTNQTFRRADVVTDLTQPDDELQVDYFINAGKSESIGLEFEGRAQISEMFSVNGTLAYIDSEYKTFNSGFHNEVFGTEDAGGKNSERFPKWSGSLSGVLQGDLSVDVDWFARADLFYTGERYIDELNLAKIDANTQLNLRGGVESDNYRLELYVLNATDDDTLLSSNRFRDLSFDTVDLSQVIGYTVEFRDKRQVGIRATYKF